jgi:hypothetical protein
MNGRKEVKNIRKYSVEGIPAAYQKLIKKKIALKITIFISK